MSKRQTDHKVLGDTQDWGRNATWTRKNHEAKMPVAARELVAELKRENIQIDYVEIHPDGVIRAGRYPEGYQLEVAGGETASGPTKKDDLWNRWASRL